MSAGLSDRKDHSLVSVIGALFGVFAIPILENIQPPGWELTFFSAATLILGFSLFANFALWIAGLIGKKYPPVFQFAKYAATGAMNSFLDIGILNLLSMTFQVFAGPLIILFNTISFSVAVTNSYFWNNAWVFKKAAGGPNVAEFWKFLGVTLSGVAINTAIVYVVTTLIGHPEGISPALWENIAKLIAVPTAVIWNFFGYKFFVFKKQPA